MAQAFFPFLLLFDAALSLQGRSRSLFLFFSFPPPPASGADRSRRTPLFFFSWAAVFPVTLRDRPSARILSPSLFPLSDGISGWCSFFFFFPGASFSSPLSSLLVECAVSPPPGQAGEGRGLFSRALDPFTLFPYSTLKDRSHPLLFFLFSSRAQRTRPVMKPVFPFRFLLFLWQADDGAVSRLPPFLPQKRQGTFPSSFIPFTHQKRTDAVTPLLFFPSPPFVPIIA